MREVARAATVEDAPEVVRLGAQMFLEMGLDPDGAWRANAERRVAEGLADGSVAAWVVDDPDAAGGLAASACATVSRRLPGPHNPHGIAAYVQYVCTEPRHRGHGHGRAVMEALLDWCRAQGARVVELHATPDGEPLYRSLGFADAANPALRLRLGDG